MPADPPALATADLRSLTTEALEEGLCGFAARLAAATCVFILAIAEYDRRRAWEAWECRSMAHWLTWKCAMGPVAAREHVRVGAALAALPVVRSQFATGAISYSQARAITRVATADTEETFVEMAKAMTAAQLERLVRAYRRARPVAADPTTASRALRGLQWCYDDDGSVVGRFRLAPEDGALVVKALEAATASRAADRADATEDCLDPALDVFAANQADGLIDLATAYLNRRAKDEGSAGDDDRYLVTIVAERRVLQAEGGDDDGVCEIDGGPGLEVSVARRITCDQPTVTILEDARPGPRRRSQDTPYQSPFAASASPPRSAVLLPGVWLVADGSPPCEALDRRWPDVTRQSGLALSPPPPAASRWRLFDRAGSRWQLDLRSC